MNSWDNLKELREKILVFILGASLALAGLLGQVDTVKAQNKPISFSLQSLDGRTVSSASLQGKVVVLALDGKNDPLESAFLPQLQRLVDRYQGRPVVVVWVSNDSDHPGLRNYATNQELQNVISRAKFTGIALRDPQGGILHAVGANQIPSIVLIDRSGNISSPLIAGFDPDTQDAIAEVSGRIDKLLQ